MLLVLFGVAFPLVWGAGGYLICIAFKIGVDNKRDPHLPAGVLKRDMLRVPIFVYGHLYLDFFVLRAVLEMFVQGLLRLKRVEAPIAKTCVRVGGH